MHKSLTLQPPEPGPARPRRRRKQSAVSTLPSRQALQARFGKLVERAAMSRTVTADKLHELLTVYANLDATEVRGRFTEAFRALQTELPILAEHGQILLRSGKTYTYARWEDIHEVITPILARHGFALSFRTGREGSDILVIGVLSHSDGHREESRMLVPADWSDHKNGAQAVGSATSYGKRYVAQALLNLASRGEDDDAVAAERSGSPITPLQLEELNTLIARTDADLGKYLAYLGVADLAALPADRFQQAKDALLVRRLP